MGEVSDLPTQTWNPQQYARNARFVSDLGAPVLELLAPRPGERILDRSRQNWPLSDAKSWV